VSVANPTWPSPLSRFWVPSVQDIYDAGPELAVVAGAHAGLALVIRAIEYAHGELEGADDNDLAAMTADVTSVDALLAIEILVQARSLATTFRAYARERQRRSSEPRDPLDDPF